MSIQLSEAREFDSYEDWKLESKRLGYTVISIREKLYAVIKPKNQGLESMRTLGIFDNIGYLFDSQQQFLEWKTKNVVHS